MSQTILRKARLAYAALHKPKLRIGQKSYALKSVFLNPITVRHAGVSHEPWIDAVFGQILNSRPGVFVDVGVNLGQTLFKILALDPGRRYVGFEPQLACAFMLQSFIDENRSTR